LPSSPVWSVGPRAYESRLMSCADALPFPSLRVSSFRGCEFHAKMIDPSPAHGPTLFFPNRQTIHVTCAFSPLHAHTHTPASQPIGRRCE
jgi:hypothetical protein